MSEDPQAIVLFDGVCNFCSSSVNFIIKRDKKAYFRFAPLQSEAGQKLLAQYSIDTNETESLILIEDKAAYFYSTGALRIARNLDGVWRYFYWLIIIPRPLRDFFYKLFARYRYTFFGKKDLCMIPTPEIRGRFFA